PGRLSREPVPPRRSSDLTPTMAISRTTSGASVRVSATAGSAILRSQAISPVALLIANIRPSSAIEITLSFHSATPRLLTPQQARSEEHTSELQSLAYLVC